MKSGDEEKKKKSQLLHRATNLFLTDEMQKDLELLQLMRSSTLSFKQQHEFLQIIAPAPKNESTDLASNVVRNILFPHVLSVNLFGDIFARYLGHEHVEYTKTYIQGGCDNLIPKDTEIQPSPVAARHLSSFEAEGRLLTPNFNSTEFATAQDYQNHLKLMRLFEDYYGIDITTEEGMAMIDQLIHTYDISSGESTLDRAQPIPMPAHSFDELPLLKYDGYDDCPYEPEPDTYVKEIDTTPITKVLEKFVQQLAEKTGQPITLSSLVENNKLTDAQYKVLRSILHLQNPDLGGSAREVEMMEKVWGLVLPQSEIHKLFHDQYQKFSNDESHH